MSWAALLTYECSDPTHQTVNLLPPAAGNLYVPGDTVQVTPSSTILDPAGNQASTSGGSSNATAS